MLLKLHVSKEKKRKTDIKWEKHSINKVNIKNGRITFLNNNK